MQFYAYAYAYKNLMPLKTAKDVKKKSWNTSNAGEYRTMLGNTQKQIVRIF